MALTVDHHRVQHPPTVVHGQVARQSDFARVAVDLDHRQVHAERKRLALGLEEAIGLESGLVSLGHLAVVRAASNGRQRGRPIWYPAHADAPGGDLHVRGRGLQVIRGKTDHFVAHPLGRAEHGAAAHGRRTAAKGSHASGHDRRVVEQHTDVLELHTELIRDDLSERGDMALPVG